MDLAAIREALARLTDLTVDELDALRAGIIDVFDGITGNDPEAVSTMTELADALTTVKTEITARADAAAAAEAEATTQRERMAELARDDDGEGDGDDATPPADGEAGDGDDDPEGGAGDGAAGADDREPVTAGAGAPGNGTGSGRASRMNRGRGAPAGNPTPTGINVSAPLVASGAVRDGVQPGDPFTSRRDLGVAMAGLLNRMPRHGGPRGDVIVASARYALPPERTLDADPDENARKVEALLSRTALVASGGVCAPVNVDYGMPTWSTDERPLKAGLPTFGADRGGINFVPPPTLASTSGASEVWTEAMDASVSGGSPSKPVYVVACGTPQTVYVNAIPCRLQFGNMQGRFAPEQVAANTDLAIAQAARVAELELLALMDAASTLITTAQWLGATRDLLADLDLAIAGYRYRNRIPESQGCTAVFPEWVKGLIRADLTRQLAVSDAPLGVPDSAIEAWFSARNVSTIWTLDGRPAKVSGTTYSAQTFATQAAGAINKWPNASGLTQVVWNLYVDGTMQFLDGGSLDLGVVRDSTLDSTNDYETFVEPFEGLAFRGVEALTIISSVNPTGASGATVASLASPVYYTPGN